VQPVRRPGRGDHQDAGAGRREGGEGAGDGDGPPGRAGDVVGVRRRRGDRRLPVLRPLQDDDRLPGVADDVRAQRLRADRRHQGDRGHGARRRQPGAEGAVAGGAVGHGAAQGGQGRGRGGGGQGGAARRGGGGGGAEGRRPAADAGRPLDRHAGRRLPGRDVRQGGPDDEAGGQAQRQGDGADGQAVG